MARLLAVLLLSLVPGSVTAQDDVEGVFENLGTVKAVDETAAHEVAKEGEGTIRGLVIDGETGSPVAGATVIVVWPSSEPDVDPLQEVQVTDAAGAYEFPAIPEGKYTLSFIKAGYRTSSMTNFEVIAGQGNAADFPMPPIPTSTSEQVMELDAFVVEASTVNEMMNALELRLDSDELLNVMNAEDLAKFAAGDVADALKRVAGVNVVEGQFAIIRGLEDRYSSTLYNSAPVPSPDPDKQSVQLDLFPSDVVDNLVVSKTFGADLPSNSSGGSINVVTHEYGESPFKLKLSSGTGFNSNVRDGFWDRSDQLPVGKYDDGFSGGRESDYSASLTGRRKLFGREFRLKGVFQQEIDFETKEGFEEDREPQQQQQQFVGFDFSTFPFTPLFEVSEAGDLATGQLSLTSGRFDTTESERSEQKTNYFGFGFDLDTAGTNRVDASIFHTKKEEDTVRVKENGFLSCLDYGAAIGAQRSGDPIGGQRGDLLGGCTTLDSIAENFRADAVIGVLPTRGSLAQAPYMESKSTGRNRDLLATQATGEHGFAPIDGLKLTWAANHARTTQEESQFGAKLFFEPTDPLERPTDFPARPEDFSGGRWGIYDVSKSDNEIEETQNFARIDAEYERGFLDDLFVVKVTGGGWWEGADRDVAASFLENALRGAGQSDLFVVGPPGNTTPTDAAAAIFDTLLLDTQGNLAGTRRTTNESSRDIRAWSVGTTVTIDEQLDLFGGARFEDITIESINDPFTGEPSFDGSPGIFPTKYLFFDCLDNPNRGEILPAQAPPPCNADILGLNPTPTAAGFVDLVDRQQIQDAINGEIDERKTLPSLGFAWRPLEGLQLRGAWSKTVARPSFREMGYYVSVSPSSDELVVGNPALQLSDVESWDARVEYTWGPLGDLAAFSLFRKEIDLPIESIVIRNPVNLEESSSALFRTFFNNPNQADLWGFELEARKHFDFLPFDIGEYVSVGGNYTFIDAEVGRTDAEIARARSFFGALPGSAEIYSALESKRRLFGQPEWIANADISFDHPDWGTKATLAWFAISDVLDAAGSATIGPNNDVRSLTIDRYVDSFHQLDLILSQKWRSFTLKFSAKNLTDSTRAIVYDREQTAGRIPEREFRVGRDYSLSISYTLEF